MRHAQTRASFARSIRCAVAAGLAIAVGVSVNADDRDLLRFKTANPYLFILLDTSGSMSMPVGEDAPALGHADDPGSRLFAAKEALFTVFENVSDVNFGFAAMNHDQLRATSAHWIYYFDALPANWPFDGQGNTPEWPVLDPDGLTTDIPIDHDNDPGTPDQPDGIPDNDVEGDVIVVGKSFIDGAGNPIPGGTCSQPLDLEEEDDIAKLDAFALLGADGNTTSEVWVDFGNGGNAKRHRLRFWRPGTKPDSTPNGGLGDDDLHIKIEVSGDVSNCNSIPSPTTYNFFLRRDPHLNRFLMVDEGVPGGPQGSSPLENTQALWPWNDLEHTTTCNGSHPHSGKGWEGNYDADTAALIAAGLEQTSPPLTDRDVFCSNPADPSTCISMRPQTATTLSPLGRPMDYGDVLPFNWTLDNRDLMLQRLAPNWPAEPPNFTVQYHLTDQIDPATGFYRLRVPGREPLAARGETPIAKALNDVRCWYMGAKGGNQAFQKCGASAYFDDDGWSAVACAHDPDYGCRRPYLILVSDGEDICKGNNGTSEVSDMKSFTGVQTWALNLGEERHCRSGGGLHSIVQSSGGECINVADKEELKDTLEDILGRIREQARAFATAAVPTVQTTTDQAIYVSSFTPLNDKSRWDGHLNAFLKPIPLTDAGTPDTSVTCGSGVVSGCKVWDAGTAMESQANAAAPIGTATNQRRVAYPLLAAGAGVPRAARMLLPIDCSDPMASTFDDCLDLLQAMQIPYNVGIPAAMASAQNQANAVIADTLALKTHTLTDQSGNPGDTISYVLGDIFHSNPVVVGSPTNINYFVSDLGGDGTPCTDDDSGNPGYRCFFLRHRLRRKVLVVGSNDGQLHAFDAGRFVESGTDPGTGRPLDFEIGNGTGQELFSFMPRKVMPTVKAVANGDLQEWMVDGPPAIADVFIDPKHNGSPTPADRRFRTVAITGLREGGAAYFAIDLTNPDYLKKAADGLTTIPDDLGASDWVPRCLKSYSAAECGPTPYPAILWELNDDTSNQFLASGSVVPPSPLLMDEDMNLVPDLGDTWSKANIGRIRVCNIGGTHCDPDPVDPMDDDDLRDIHVAIFGGGVDPGAADKASPAQGDFLYMVDIETGRVLYKRRLCDPHGAVQTPVGCDSAGSAAASPAAVDTDQDGYIDRIYQVTTGGFVFRVDLDPMSNGQMPTLTNVDTYAWDSVGNVNVSLTVLRVAEQDTASEPLWAPIAIFDANWDTDGVSSPVATAHARQLYHAPAVFFDARLARFGLAFGSGNREDLWLKNQQSGRFYTLIDDTDSLLPGNLPRNESNYEQVAVGDANIGVDLLLSRGTGEKGWFIVLDPDDRAITEGFALSGITAFSIYTPETAINDDPTCDPITDPSCETVAELTCGDKKFESDTDNLCARAGISKNFVVGTINADGYLFDTDGTRRRYKAVSTFVTDPYTESGQNKNSGAGDTGSPTSDALTDTDILVMDELKGLFPTTCRFANYRIDIKTVASDTRVERIAPIPVCIVEKNWKEY